MDSDKNSILTLPVAILLGSFVISIAILLHGGIIKVGQPVGAGGTKQVADQAADNAPAQPEKTELESLRDNDHIQGNKNARILLVEYSDLECPFCKRFHPTAKQIVDEYKGQVAWVYRHFPLEQIHPKARKYAEASECATELGGIEAFWKMADAIYEPEVTPEIADLATIASTKLGLDQAKFKSCLDSGKYKAYIDKDIASGSKAGVNGTPGNILLDTKTGKTVDVAGAVPFEQMKTQIDSLLK
ncbi:DsbA family protein [Candidatus Daviesbacteria bacterium]|nr:DsbA family protein [Candidatus Daviesbacteria bacterium]